MWPETGGAPSPALRSPPPQRAPPAPARAGAGKGAPPRPPAADAARAHRAGAAGGPDEGGGGNGLAAGRLYDDFVPFSAKAGHPGTGTQLDRALLPAAGEQRAVDIGAVRHRVRIAEALREARVERDVDHRLAADAVHHQQALDEDGLLRHSLAAAESIDGVPGVRRELDAGADLAELGRLLEHDDPEVAPRQAERPG